MNFHKLVARILFVGLLLGWCPGAPLLGVAEASASSEAAGQGAATADAEGLNWYDLGNKQKPALLALFFNFACLAVILYFILRKPLAARFANRKLEFETAIREAREMKSRAEKALAEAREKSQALDVAMERLRTDIIEAGKAESVQILEDANRQSARMREDVKLMVEQEVVRMAQAIREEIVAEMVKMAESRLKEKVNEEDHHRLARDYLDGMSPKSIPPAGKPAGGA